MKEYFIIFNNINKIKIDEDSYLRSIKHFLKEKKLMHMVDSVPKLGDLVRHLNLKYTKESSREKQAIFINDEIISLCTLSNSEAELNNISYIEDMINKPKTLRSDGNYIHSAITGLLEFATKADVDISINSNGTLNILDGKTGKQGIMTIAELNRWKESFDIISEINAKIEKEFR